MQRHKNAGSHVVRLRPETSGLSENRTPRPRFFAGLDVAMVHDYSAVAIFERHRFNEQDLDIPTVVEDRLVHLERWRIPYPDLLERLRELFARPELRHKAVLAMDATGPGLPFYEDLKRDKELAGVLRGLSPVVITSGENVTEEAGRFHVPKTRLITPLQVAFQRSQVKIPKTLPYITELVEELRGYEMKVTASRNVTYSNNPREGGPEHDDLIIACALAYWRLTARQKRRTVRLVG